MPEKKIYTAKNIFTGEEWLKDQSIVVHEGIIEDIIPATASPDCDTILPAFVDLQIYGAYGKLFSVYPEPGTLALIHQYCRSGGAYWFQPTVATNTKETIQKCIQAVREYQCNGGEGCIGLHVEGPWISKAKRGAHIESLIHSPTIDEVKELLDYGGDVISMITLAPEVCSDAVIETIQEHGVVISAGHSNASYQQAKVSFSKGVTAVTHLYNAMSGLQHREPGLVGAAMLSEEVCASIIADGHHVDYAAIRIAKEVMKDRLFLITDAVTETSSGAYPHQPEGEKYVASGILSGSALTMMQAVKNIIEYAGIDSTAAIRMACTIPARLVKRNAIGKLTKGGAAHVIQCNAALDILHNPE